LLVKGHIKYVRRTDMFVCQLVLQDPS